jgi:hypothetical protein
LQSGWVMKHDFVLFLHGGSSISTILDGIGNRGGAWRSIVASDAPNREFWGPPLYTIKTVAAQGWRQYGKEGRVACLDMQDTSDWDAHKKGGCPDGLMGESAVL